MREQLAELLESEAGLMYKMVTMVPPGEAVRAGVRVCRLLQKPGTFVVTWPRAYHAGFSHGVNCAESSNFATPDWLPWGRQSASAALFRTAWRRCQDLGALHTPRRCEQVEIFRTTRGARLPCFTHAPL